MTRNAGANVLLQRNNGKNVKRSYKMPRGKPTGWSVRLYDYIQKHEGKTVREILAAVKYVQKYEYGYNLIFQLTKRGAVVYIDQKVYLSRSEVKPNPDPTTKNKAPPRQPTVWKPLQLARTPWQRPTYDAPGCVIRAEPEGIRFA